MRSFEQTPEYRHSLIEQPDVELVTMEMREKTAEEALCEYPEDQATQPLMGKGGAHYLKHGAFCLETQNFPDAVNHENFPRATLSPGEMYFNQTILQFGTAKTC